MAMAAGTNRSEELFREAVKYIPGGVNSPVRAFKSVGGNPLYIERAKGSRLYDVDGNEYIDYVCSWGPLILGHAHPAVTAAISAAAGKGTSYGANTEIEVSLARAITGIYPSIERVRLVNSGTEATMSAVRLARAFTGKDRIIKFDGCYHGHADSFLIKAGSGLLTFGAADSPGVTQGTAQDTLVARYNDIESVKRIITANRGRVAAVILEPVAGNVGVIPPREGFLRELRALTAEESIILIFDEVITGFRVSLGGAQELYGIKPDMTCLGKIIGGGLPVGAFGGRADIMGLLAPLGPVYQAGTLAGNPLAVSAGLETISLLKAPGVYAALEERSRALEEGFCANAKRLGASCRINRVGSMMCAFFTAEPVTDADSARLSNTALFAKYFTRMMRNGIYIAPSQFEAGFVSLAHTADDIEKTIEAHFRCLKEAL
jgi:glutamate-1-semialdehyde 2,1-aminomutase